jgi:hypothetical protein
MKDQQPSTRNEILKQIYNAIALLGGKDDILEMICAWASGSVSEEEVLQQLKNWNVAKIDEIKNRLDRTSKRSVNVTNFN